MRPWAVTGSDTLVLAHPMILEWNQYQRQQVHSVETDGRNIPIAGFTSAEAARRAVVCVNACAGLSTEWLDANAPLVDRIRGLEAELGRLRSAQLAQAAIKRMTHQFFTVTP